MEMNQDEIVSKISDRIREHIWYWITELESKNELLNASEMFRNFASRLGYLHSHFDERQPNEIYEELKKILKKIVFVEDLIDELMSPVKMLDKKHLEDLIYNLETEFYRTTKEIESDLEKLEAQNKEE